MEGEWDPCVHYLWLVQQVLSSVHPRPHSETDALLTTQVSDLWYITKLLQNYRPLPDNTYIPKRVKIHFALGFLISIAPWFSLKYLICSFQF